jgi:hypothetical protein
MKKTFRVFGIIAIIAVIGFSMAACSDDSGGSNSLVGTWYYSQSGANSRISSNVAYEFKSNGDLVVENYYSFRYESSGNRITMYVLGTPFSANYSISGTELTIWGAGSSGFANGTYYKPR